MLRVIAAVLVVLSAAALVAVFGAYAFLAIRSRRAFEYYYGR